MFSIVEIGDVMDEFSDVYAEWGTSKATRQAMRDIAAMGNRPMLGEGKNPMATSGEFRRRDHMNRK